MCFENAPNTPEAPAPQMYMQKLRAQLLRNRDPYHQLAAIEGYSQNLNHSDPTAPQTFGHTTLAPRWSMPGTGGMYSSPTNWTPGTSNGVVRPYASVAATPPGHDPFGRW